VRNFINHAPMEVADDIRMHQRPDQVAASAGSRARSLLVLPRALERRAAAKCGLRRKLLVAVITILSSMSVAVAAASSGHNGRHMGHAGRAAATGRAQSFEPPRMIEVRPGWWISTYDCVTDEGQGRWRPCSAGGG
jgi:hypothetical protein